MSNYRDDSTDTATTRATALGAVQSVFEDVVRVSDALFFGIAITLSSTAVASDEVIDAAIYSSADTATATDTVIDTLHASRTDINTAAARDSLYFGLGVSHSDAAIASDQMLTGSIGSIITDAAIVEDSAYGQRIVSTLASDTAIASDFLTRITSDLSIDSATVSDTSTNRLLAADLIKDTATASDTLLGSIVSLTTDTATVSDKVIDNRAAYTSAEDTATASDVLLYSRLDINADTATASADIIDSLYARDIIDDTASISATVIDSIIQSNITTDTATAYDSVIDSLHAAHSWQDTVVVQDEVINTGGYKGQTWTANVDSWAMSRHDPVSYNRLVVIDDVLYGEADDGIYRLDEQVSAVTASVKTGKMDLGKGALTHPSTAYLEYELNGGASMTVSTTQKGVEQQYTYMLPNEVADELTNGRFIFGRGLRGRHFAFELIMIGTHGHVNDLSIEHTPTSRRV